MLSKSPWSYIEKIKNKKIYNNIQLNFFDQHDQIMLSSYLDHMRSDYKSMIHIFLYEKYPLKNMKNNIVLVYNDEDKKKVNYYYITMIILSDCNCHYSNKIHFINERIIISLVKREYSNFYNLEFKQISDHQIDLITSNNIDCTKEFIKNNEKCPLCYKDYQPDEKLIKLSCNHIFCNDQECLKEWLKIKKICPYCNHDI